MLEVARYSGCFVCGQKNDIGLKARFFFKDGKAVTEYTAEKRFEGYHGVFHGGITATLLDEVMIKALLAKDIYALTVELTVRFHKTVHVGQKLKLTGRVEKSKGRLYVTSGEVTSDDGELVATATGKYLEVKGDMKNKLLESLET
ncbi:MAG: PaaI family thioesterase [Candidatus Zixiibacteriota bacterium]|nr:MAG: PaaI family thioesterase [candidate division Zixibacteria bacterium]HDL02933.1 PaaI family thioesterase [candidate division Zixibacteria bacterium]